MMKNSSNVIPMPENPNPVRKKRDEVFIGLAIGLANLCETQKHPDAIKTVGELRRINKTYGHYGEIPYQFARALASITFEPNIDAMERTVQELRDLYEARKDNERIAVELAFALVNIANQQEPDDIWSTVDELKYLYEAFDQNEVITYLYERIHSNIAAQTSFCGTSTHPISACPLFQSARFLRAFQ